MKLKSMQKKIGKNLRAYSKTSKKKTNKTNILL